MENGVDYYCTYILNCCYCWSFFHHTGRWCNKDCFKIFFRRRPCSLSCSLSRRRPCSRSGNTRWRGATQSHRYANTNTYILELLCISFLCMCACVFVQHRATGIQIQIHTWTFTYFLVCVCLCVLVCLFNTGPQGYQYISKDSYFNVWPKSASCLHRVHF